MLLFYRYLSKLINNIKNMYRVMLHDATLSVINLKILLKFLELH